MSRFVTQPVPEVAVQTQGRVPEDSAAYVRAKVLTLAGQVREPILFARVKLTYAADPALARPAIAQANLDVNGRLVRAHVAAATMREAIDALQDRLRDRLARIGEHWEDRRGGMPVAQPHEWRHGSEPSHRPGHYPRPAGERELVRHKTFTLAVETPDEAAFEMDSMDYDFHLFTDIETGQDSVIYRAGPTGYRWAQLQPLPMRHGPIAVPLTLSPHPAPRLSVAEAIERLEHAGWPFAFFADAATGRGSVVYHRYDGHYGLITPAA